MAPGFRTILASAAATAATVTGLAAPAQAATYPTLSFYIPYGNSTASGVITWYNRSINIAGSLRITSGQCRSLFASTWASNGELGQSPKGEGFDCNFNATTITSPFDFGVNADKPGGAALVRICLVGEAYDGPVSIPDLPDLNCQNYPRPS